MQKQNFRISFDEYSLEAQRIITDDSTNRPTLVFLHDSLGCIALWRDFPCKIAEAVHCNVLVYDRRGYGSSDPMGTEARRKDYMEKEAGLLPLIFEKCGIRKAILWGFSDGASISLIAAAKYPEYIEGIIAEGAHVFVEDITLAGIKEAYDAYLSTNLKQKLEKYHGANTEALFMAWAQTWQKPEFRDWNIEHLLSAVSCPVMVLQGENDEFGSIAQVHAIVNQVSGDKEAHLLANAAHTAHKEQEKAALEYSIDFIERILGER